MPYKTEWVPADLFLEYKGVKIYHAYNDDEPFNYHYQLGDGTDYTDIFDIRDLRTYTPMSSHESIIRAAIEIGEINPIE